jgi:hypothetical protein
MEHVEGRPLRPLSVAVSWRRAVGSVLVIGLATAAVVVALRADGFRAVDATVPRSTRWFVDRSNGRVVLADGFGGRMLARIDVDADGAGLAVAQSASGVAVFDRSAATARSIDAAALRLGPPQSLSLVAAPDAVFGVGQAGVVAVDPANAEAVLLPPDGDQVPFDLATAGRSETTRIAGDGAVWTLADGELARITSTSREVVASDLTDGRFTLAGTAPLVLDGGRRRARLGDGDWVTLPAGPPISEIVLQQPGPTADCGADLLAIAGDAAALVRRASSSIVRIDWRAARLIDGTGEAVASVPSGSQLNVSVSVDLVWIDQIDGDLVWSIHPWGINVLRKDDASSPLLGESGELLEAGDGGKPSTGSASGAVVAAGAHEPDDNGIDDPPVAVDDPVTARTGAGVPIAVTANDYDPDGEAIALASAARPSHGTVDIVSASMLTYLPAPGYVGSDTFEYTIVDGNGTEATAAVTLELLPADAVNQAPVGAPDTSETGPDAAVVVDVLLNDVDPERDGLRVGSFTPADIGGTVTETVAPSGLPGLRYVPPAGASGTATFSYRPVDVFGATGEPVSVKVEIAQPGDANRPPVAVPDGVRARRDIAVAVPVLANDRDPDGDRMRVGLVQPLPAGVDVRVRGDELEVIVRAGAAALSPFAYTLDDGHGHLVRGAVLVALIADAEPNRPPVANPDTQSAVIGRATTIDVLANDVDPDGDTMVLLAVEQPDGDRAGSVSVQGDFLQYSPGSSTDDDVVFDQFSYVIGDGNGHEATGHVTVRVLPEPVAAPPFARDDSATTEVDVPVTLDVLRNDGDPSGERPTLVGAPGCAGGGTTVVTPDSRVTFTPPAGASGVFSCTYEVTNSQGLRAGAAIVVSVTPRATVNLPPVVVDEELTIVVGASTTVDLLANDSDPDDPVGSLRVLSSTTPSLGQAQRDGRSVTFDAGSVTGVTTITYQVGDPDGGVTTGRLVFRIVEQTPVAPNALDDQRTIIGPGAPTTIDVLANDNDPDGIAAELGVTSVTLVSGSGTVSNAARTVTFVPSADFVGELAANYVVTDADGLTDTGRVVLTVLIAPNRAPIARDDSVDVANGASISVPIALNDEDPDGDQLSYSITSSPNPDLGSARLQGASLVFESVPGASGVAVAQYTVNDGDLTSSATVRISVLPCASAPPSAPDVFLQTGYQQPIFVDLHTVAANGEIVDVGQPLGAASGTYTPPAGENGNVSFSYVVRNTCRVQDVGRVTIDVNQDPLGASFTAGIGRTQPFLIPISVLASDIEPLTIARLDGAPDWVTLIDGARTIRLDPAGRSGMLTMTAVVTDPGGLTVNVPVSIELVNLAPVAQPDSVRVVGVPITFAPLANDSDPDGDVITLHAPATVTFSNGVEVALEPSAGQQLRIDPGLAQGSTSFTYTAVDALGLSSAPATVTIVINAAPVALPVDVSVALGGSIGVPVAASDPNGDPLTLTVEGDPAPLSVAVNGLTLTITVPSDVVLGVFPVGYTVTDPYGASASGTVLVTVLPL